MEQARGQVGDRDYDNLVQEASAFILSPNNFRSANSKNQATGSQRIETREIWLILPEATALGVRLSHASRELSELGILLSNTWITCPIIWNNLGKLRTRPDSSLCLERFVNEGRMGLRRIRL